MDRFYVAVRQDLLPGQQMAQAIHAALAFAYQHDDLFAAWHKDSNYLVVLGVADEVDLLELTAEANKLDIEFQAFQEPDLDDQFTAVAFQPGDTARKLCARLPLALRSSNA